MATSYPSGYDSFEDPAASDTLSNPSHADLHVGINDAIEAIQSELGTNPRGSQGTVNARFGFVEDNLAFPATPANLRLVGHSYMDARGIGVPENQCLGARLADVFGILPGQLQNVAVSGGIARWHTGSSSYKTVLENVNPGAVSAPYVPDTAVTAVMFNTNDAIQGTATWAGTSYKEAMKTIIARYQAASVYDYNDSSIAQSAGWSTYLYENTGTYGSGAGYLSTVLTGTTLTITVPSDFEGGTVDLGFLGSYAGGTASVTVDGSPHGTITTSDMTTSGNAGKRTGLIYRITGLAAGTHEIIIEVTAITHSGPFEFDYWQIKANPEPVVLAIGMPLPPNPQWAWAGIDQTRTDQYNTWLNEVVDFFNSESVRFVDTDSVIGGDADYFAVDGLHPNARGAAIIAGLVYDEYRKAFKTGNIGSYQAAAYWSGQTNPDYPRNHFHKGNGEPMVIVDGFTGEDDPNALSAPATATGWLSDAGVWGITNNSAYVSRSLFDDPTFEDEFTRADSASSLGGSWTANLGTWGISSNEAYLVSSGGLLNTATVDTSITDHFVEFDFGADSEGVVGVVLRYSDQDNFIRVVAFQSFGTVAVVKRVAGVETTVGSALFAQSDGTTIHVEMKGTEIYVHNADTMTALSGAPFTIADGALQTGTAVGLFANSSVTTNFKWDRFAYGASCAYPGSEINVLYQDFGWADGTIQFEVGQREDWYGAVFRYSDPENYYRLIASVSFGNWALRKRESNVETTVGVIKGTNASGTKVRIEMDGDTFRFYFNGEESSSGATTGQTFNQAETKHGIQTNINFWLDDNDDYLTFPKFWAGVGYVEAYDGDMYLDYGATPTTIYGPFNADTQDWDEPVEIFGATINHGGDHMPGGSDQLSWDEVMPGAQMYTGLWYDAAAHDLTALSMTQNLEYAVPIYVSRACTLDRIAVRLSSQAGASGVMRLGIRNNNNGVPGTVLLDAGTVNANVAAPADLSVTIDLDVTPGLYWLVVVAQGSATAGGLQAGYSPYVGILAGQSSMGATRASGYTQSGISGALSTWSGATPFTSAAPRVFIRAV